MDDEVLVLYNHYTITNFKHSTQVLAYNFRI